ncbi:MAG: septum formation protein Maf [Calditrichaeota bacterium]|nr:septum formation protein Maf [Calditrichota bacterium]
MSDSITIPEIILASSSPRRRMLLKQIGVPFRIILPDCAEKNPDKDDFPSSVIHNAGLKANSVLTLADGSAVLGADTVVELNGEPLGKPSSLDEAAKMLRSLSGKSHYVHTGIVLIDSASGLQYQDHDITQVFFRELPDTEIEDYVASGEPMDKAGSYGIQERGALLVRRVEGCFFNVMGLPVSKLWEMLMKWLSEK